jgi:hypothetical protein
VREVASLEFAVTFPSAELLRALSWSETTTLLLHNIKVAVRPSCVDPETVASLSSVWVRVHGVPEAARKDPFIELISQAIGKLVEVDSRSLAGHGPLRLQIFCPDPSKLTTTISPFFFGRVGRSLSVELEREEDQRGSPSPSPHLDQSDRRDAGEGDDDSSGDDDDLSDGGGGDEAPRTGDSAPPSARLPPG